MILVDTSVWIDHLANEDATMARLLADRRVLRHPFVIGELSMGNLRDRRVILDGLCRLPSAILAKHDEVLHIVESYGLFGIGIGYVDAHLLATTRITPETALWTRDKRLYRGADKLGLIAYQF